MAVSSESVLLSLVFLAHGLFAQPQPAPVLTIRDLTPKFLTFYQAAEQEHATESRRWELWQKLYGFAAVPPTPEGDAMARKILDNAWPKYAAALPVIRQGAASLKPPPRDSLDAVAKLLGADVPIRATLILFVGGFDNQRLHGTGRGRDSDRRPAC